jgi:hypothetical protein
MYVRSLGRSFDLVEQTVSINHAIQLQLHD